MFHCVVRQKNVYFTVFHVIHMVIYQSKKTSITVGRTAHGQSFLKDKDFTFYRIGIRRCCWVLGPMTIVKIWPRRRFWSRLIFGDDQCNTIFYIPPHHHVWSYCEHSEHNTNMMNMNIHRYSFLLWPMEDCDAWGTTQWDGVEQS